MNNVPFLCTKLFQKRGHYSRGDIIQGRTLFKEIWYSKFQDFIIGRKNGVGSSALKGAVNTKVVKSRVEHLKSLQLHLGHGLVTFFPLIPYLDLPTSIPMNFLSSLVLFKSGAVCSKVHLLESF